MKVFVIGATGYIGSHIVKALQQAGHDVSGLARSEFGADQLRQRHVSVVMGTLELPSRLLPLAEKVDAVILAANVANDFEVAQTLIDGLARSNKTLIFTSGSNVYGGRGDEPVDEMVEPEPSPTLEYEKLILNGGNRGLKTMIIRPTLVYGPNGSPVFVRAFINTAKEAGVSYYIGDGSLRISTVHVEDLADLYVKTLGNAPNKSVFNAANAPVYLKELAEAISLAVGLGGEAKSLPPEKASNQVWPRTSWALSRQNLSSTRARETLGWIPSKPSIISELQNRNSIGADIAPLGRPCKLT